MTDTARSTDLAAGPVSLNLKESTADHHHRAEQSPFQRLLVSGRLPQAGYVGWLGQMHAIYSVLEAELARPELRQHYPDLANSRWGKLAQLNADLAHFGVPAPAPLAETTAFTDQIKGWARGPAIFGPLYVLEGSTNGSRYIARALRKAYNLESAGLAFMDPYGDGQPQQWAEFKTALDKEIRKEDAALLVTSAADTFDAVSAIGTALNV